MPSSRAAAKLRSTRHAIRWCHPHRALSKGALNEIWQLHTELGCGEAVLARRLYTASHGKCGMCTVAVLREAQCRVICVESATALLIQLAPPQRAHKPTNKRQSPQNSPRCSTALPIHADCNMHTAPCRRAAHATNKTPQPPRRRNNRGRETGGNEMSNTKHTHTTHKKDTRTRPSRPPPHTLTAAAPLRSSPIPAMLHSMPTVNSTSQSLGTRDTWRRRNQNYSI